jgi:hypothetical protein
MNPSEIGATFQIPKFEAQAELLFVDNRRLTGRLFLSILPASPLGHTSVLDWLNEPMNFFPFLPDQRNEAMILNKQQLVYAVVNAELNQDDVADMLEETTWIEQVEVACDPFVVLKGKILLNMPPDKARVLDFLNQPMRFFAIKEGNQSYIVHKRYITGVKELSSLMAPKPIIATRTKRSSTRASKK